MEIIHDHGKEMIFTKEKNEQPSMTEATETFENEILDQLNNSLSLLMGGGFLTLRITVSN